eukprot:TRINITY_DN15585_c1_g2_i2.p1 TRINITY_DN15585_c1_g2~~TRINITY_DN15585_c1_g2_i2.p1  ORF type:complete len:315 (+),score=25.36 TRINITY_DN15585_c1_g2_i2:32-976(+)
MVGQRSCASIIYTMVVANRIAYLSKLLDSGMKFVVSGATNPDQLVQKIKFHVYPAVYVQPQDQLFAAMALDWLRSCEDKCRLADRGHKHSDGHTEVAFYLTLRNRIGADHWRTPGSGEDHGGVLVHDRQSPEGPRGQRKAAREAEREAARKLAMKTHQAREGSQGFEGFEHDGFEEPGTSSLTGSQFASSVMGCPQNGHGGGPDHDGPDEAPDTELEETVMAVQPLRLSSQQPLPLRSCLKKRPLRAGAPEFTPCTTAASSSVPGNFEQVMTPTEQREFLGLQQQQESEEQRIERVKQAIMADLQTQLAEIEQD